MGDDERFEVVSELRVLKQRFEDFMVRTDDFRKNIDGKIDNIGTSNLEMQKFCTKKQEEKANMFITLSIAFLIPTIVLIFNMGSIYQRLTYLEKISYGYQDSLIGTHK